MYQEEGDIVGGGPGAGTGTVAGPVTTAPGLEHLLVSLQLTDSAFPSGFYTLSHSLEGFAHAKAVDSGALPHLLESLLLHGVGPADATALALAHVSACPGEGTDLAQSAADLVLRARGVGIGLAALPEAIATARRSGRLVRQNIAFSLAYNVVAVPLAISGQITPLFAALIMSSSSLVVIGNALRAGKETA